MLPSLCSPNLTQSPLSLAITRGKPPSQAFPLYLQHLQCHDQETLLDPPPHSGKSSPSLLLTEVCPRPHTLNPGQTASFTAFSKCRLLLSSYSTTLRTRGRGDDLVISDCCCQVIMLHHSLLLSLMSSRHTILTPTCFYHLLVTSSYS